jgi:tRNA A-37 threonylcarbamoyl transferase component Bud32
VASGGRFRQRLLGNRYLLLSEVGSGGMGVVYRARDRIQDKYVAVKLLHPHLRRDPSFVQRFRREADLAMRLDSRHIVQVLATGKDGNDDYLVMELVEGADLTDIIRARGPLPEATAVSYASQIARALEEAHAKGIIHRDIKPRNIMVQADGVVKVADFGIARLEDTDASRSTDEMGAGPYMDPARFSPSLYGRLDGRTDVYSLGVVMYEMLAGRTPFNGDTYELLNQIMHAEPTPLAVLRPDVSPELSDITHACLAKDPSQRPASAYEVRSAIAHLAEELPEAKPPGISKRIVRALTAPVRLVFSPRVTHNRGVRAMVTLTIAAGFLALSLAFGLLIVRPLASQDDPPKDDVPSVVAPTVGPTVVTTVTAPPGECYKDGAVAIAAVEAQCPQARFVYADNCPRGTVCGVRTDDPVAPTLLANDRTVAFVDSSGNIAVSRENSSSVRRLTSSDEAQQPAWSPDGRHIAYVRVSSVKLPGANDATPLTQLRIIDVENPSDDHVVFTSSAGDPAADYRRLVTWPRWSADGRSLLFLWPSVSDPGDTVYSVELPLDVSKLPIDAPAPGYFAATRLSRLSLNAADFGAKDGYISDFTTRPNGNLLVVFCDSKLPNPRCGLGEWDGSKAHVVTPVPVGPLQVARPQVVADDRVLAYVFAPNDDRMSLIDLNTGGETRLRKLQRGQATPTVPASLPYAPAPDGRYVIMETASSPRGLTVVPLGDGQGTFWSEGHSPAWYVAGRQAPSTVPLQSTPVDAPPLTPTPVPTPTTSSPAVVPMLVNVTVRRQGTVVSGAQVSAMVEGTECASGTTAENGFLRLTMPSPGKPAACSQLGAIVSFRVNGSAVENRVVFSPNAQASAEISLP